MTNQNAELHSNEELLSWAVENIKVWDDDYTHLRSDFSSEPFFTNTKYPWYIDYDDKQWNYDDKVSGYGYHAYLEVGEKFSTDTPQVITREDWEAAIAAKNAPTSSSEPLKGHIHAELMVEYALVAKTNPEPWREFQYWEEYDQVWLELDEDSSFHSSTEYRRKPTPPKTMNIGGIIVEAWPLEKASEVNVSRYYMPAIDCGGGFTVQDAEWYSDRYDISALENNIVFSTKEQAQAVADALNLVYNRALNKP